MAESSTATATPNPTVETKDGQTAKKEPVVIICIGMAGSVCAIMLLEICHTCRMLRSLMLRVMQGKTTLMQRLNSYLHSQNQPPYILNLDPAVSHMPYEANIDIRDTVDYKEVMKQ